MRAVEGVVGAEAQIGGLDVLMGSGAGFKGPAHGVQRAEYGGARGEQVVALAELVPVIQKDEPAGQTGSLSCEGASPEAELLCLRLID
ncbi:MAG: hypothetical protein NT029_11040 [Armatimonadetes bacterium]|nr:hypothetical protein [Armatimonadota bacterium]